MFGTTRFKVIALLGQEEGPYVGCRIIPEDQLYLMIYRVVYGPASFWECSEFVGYQCVSFCDLTEQEQREASEFEDELNKEYGNFLSNKNSNSSSLSISAFEQRRVRIASMNLYPEFKTEWKGKIVKYPVLYKRDVKLVAYAVVSAPSDLLDKFWSDISSCAVTAVGAAGVATVLGSPAAALPTFKGAFVTCITDRVEGRVRQISLSIDTDTEKEDWHKV
jgi:hypothetical protein